MQFHRETLIVICAPRCSGRHDVVVVVIGKCNRFDYSSLLLETVNVVDNGFVAGVVYFLWCVCVYPVCFRGIRVVS